MCNRFDLHSPITEVARFFEARAEANWAADYNVAPTDDILTVTQASGGRVVRKMRWGLVPPWEKEFKSAYATFNARGEGVATSRTYRDAFRDRRCLIACDAYYEWKKLSPKEKQPYRIRVAEQPFTVFAGLWEAWPDRTAGVDRLSATIVTCPANALMTGIHDRMPVILDQAAFKAWLSPDTPPAALTALMVPYTGTLQATPIGSAIGNVRNDGPELIQPIGTAITG